MNVHEAEAVRNALRSIPKAPATSIGLPPTLDELYVLPAHSSAIDPNVSLVIGNRGMGKTFWATTLADEALRREATKLSPNNARLDLENLHVTFGFADREGAVGVDSDTIESFSNTKPEALWRGVILAAMSSFVGKNITFRDAISLSETRPDDVRATLRRYDDILTRGNKKFLVLFDQLDQLANNWNDIQKLTKGLLKTALAMKSYRAIRCKIFMRTDQFADFDLFDFPDSSKVSGEATMLHWFSPDLYGLAYKWLWRDESARQVLAALLPISVSQRRAALASPFVPLELRVSSDVQAQVFDQIAGNQMGGGSKRGRPYSWILTHLMDGMGEISPRSFLHALRVAAERVPENNQDLPIDYTRIQDGVSAASDIRRRELLEDYPWILEALEPLRDMTVPVKRAELAERWSINNTPDLILRKHSASKAPIELVRALPDSTSQLLALERALEQIGVIQERDESWVNIPDIFRIAGGIKRKGGIRPQQRRQI